MALRLCGVDMTLKKTTSDVMLSIFDMIKDFLSVQPSDSIKSTLHLY